MDKPFSAKLSSSPITTLTTSALWSCSAASSAHGNSSAKAVRCHPRQPPLHASYAVIPTVNLPSTRPTLSSRPEWPAPAGHAAEGSWQELSPGKTDVSSNCVTKRPPFYPDRSEGLPPSAHINLASTCPTLSSPPSTSPPRVLRCHPDRQPRLHASYAVIPTEVAGSCRSRSGGIVARTQPWQDRRAFELCNGRLPLPATEFDYSLASTLPNNLLIFLSEFIGHPPPTHPLTPATPVYN